MKLKSNRPGILAGKAEAAKRNRHYDSSVVKKPLLGLAKSLRFVFFLAVVAMCQVCLSSTTMAADDWQIVSVNNRDYLTFENLARFYALQSHPKFPDSHPILGDSRVRLEACSNPREIYINGVKQWLSFPLLSQNGQTLVSRFDLAKTVEPCLRPTMISNLRPFYTVVLDAGHGGQDGGGHSALGLEKDYTLDVINDLKKSLEGKGMKVILTRDADNYLSLEDRAGKVNEISDSILVSVHFNSGDVTANGFEVYAMTPRGAASTADATTTTEQFTQMSGNDFDDASLALASCVDSSLLGHLPQPDRGVRRARFAVLRLTRAPAILIEGGFLTNLTESQKINDAAWRQKFAEAVAVGVQSFQTVAVRKEPPKLLADYRSEQLLLSGTIVNSAMLAANPTLLSAGMVPVSNSAPDNSHGAISSVNAR